MLVCVHHSGEESIRSVNIQRCQSGSIVGLNTAELRRSVALYTLLLYICLH